VCNFFAYDNYWQCCAQHRAMVGRLLSWQFWGFSPCRGYTLYRRGWYLAWRRGL